MSYAFGALVVLFLLVILALLSWIVPLISQTILRVLP